MIDHFDHRFFHDIHVDNHYYASRYSLVELSDEAIGVPHKL